MIFKPCKICGYYHWVRNGICKYCFKESKMNIKEAHQVMQKASGIRVGDKVRVLRSAKRGEMGSYDGIDYTEAYKTAIGKIFEVQDMAEGDVNWIQLRTASPQRSLFVPFFVLEVIKPAEKMIEINGKQWSESTIAEALKKHAN